MVVEQYVIFGGVFLADETGLGKPNVRLRKAEKYLVF
jgi:hypothetical protein